MKRETKKRLLRALVLSAAALVIGAGIGWIQVHNAERGADSPPMAGVSIGGPFTLVNQDGKTVTEKNYEGKYKLIYFGFTSCPAICPTELAKMTKAMKALPSAEADKIQPLFITVDPERDDVKTMKNYVSLFHPRLQGLTGTPAQIEAIKKTYRVYAAKEEPDGAGGYGVSHSSYIYFMGPRDELISIYKADDKAETIADDLRKGMLR